MFNQIVNTVTDPKLLASLLAALAAFATVLTLAMPLLAGSPLEKRMKSVATERSRIRVRASAAEVSSVNSVDDRSIPCPGPKTVAIAEVYHRTVRGEEPQYKDWCELAV